MSSKRPNQAKSSNIPWDWEQVFWLKNKEHVDAAKKAFEQFNRATQIQAIEELAHRWANSYIYFKDAPSFETHPLLDWERFQQEIFKDAHNLHELYITYITAFIWYRYTEGYWGDNFFFIDAFVKERCEQHRMLGYFNSHYYTYTDKLWIKWLVKEDDNAAEAFKGFMKTTHEALLPILHGDQIHLDTSGQPRHPIYPYLDEFLDSLSEFTTTPMRFMLLYLIKKDDIYATLQKFVIKDLAESLTALEIQRYIISSVGAKLENMLKGSNFHRLYQDNLMQLAQRKLEEHVNSHHRS